jgi:hypothetical protein
VQRKFKTKYAKNPPTRKAIYHWHKKFVATVFLCPEKKSGHPGVSEEDAERVRETFDYRVDVGRVNHGSHIETLWGKNKHIF